MSDARALLRQQREARKIQHPYATYSESGKLLCALCREPVKSETLWDGHLKSSSHRQKLQSLKESRRAAAANNDPSQSQKRKLDDDIGPMDTSEDGSRKRTKAEGETTPTNGHDTESSTGKDQSKEAVRTPPTLLRRTSTTPSQGVELQIPSRPATPAHRDSSSSSTPGGSALSGAAAPLPRQLAALGAGAADLAESRPSSTVPQVDESEWAAFEADIAAASAPYDQDAVISAPAMNAEEAAAAVAAIADEGEGKRKSQADIDIEDEREEATRAMEDEFEDMQELEARVQRLKDQREALKTRTGSQSQGNAEGVARIKEALQANDDSRKEEEEDDDDDNDDSEDDDDEWDGFRFRR